MPRKPSKPIDAWADLLQKEIRSGNERPAGALTFWELQKIRRDAGLPSGICSMYAWLRVMLSAGRLAKTDTVGKNPEGKKVRAVYYTIK